MMQNNFPPEPLEPSEMDDRQRQAELQKDHGVPFINTSISEAEPPKQPEDMDEESNIGTMTNPDADDDMDEFGDPFEEREE